MEKRLRTTPETRAALMDMAARLCLTFENAGVPLSYMDAIRSATYTLYPDDGEQRFGLKTMLNKAKAELGPRLEALREELGSTYRLPADQYVMHPMSRVSLPKQIEPEPVAAEPVAVEPTTKIEEHVARDPVSAEAVLLADQLDSKLSELQVDFVATLNTAVSEFVQDALGLMQKKIAQAADDMLLHSLTTMQELLDDSLRKAVANIGEHKKCSEPAPKKRPKVRVAIIGLKGDQESMLRHEYGTQLSLRIEDQKSVYGVSRNAMARYQHILYLGSFNDHAVQEKFSGLQGFEILMGGMTTIRKRLDAIVETVETAEEK